MKNSLAEKRKGTPSPILSALRGEVQARAPFWLMRQAGRYLPEYRALREKAGSFLNLCFNPEHATEVTLQPLRRFGMDAAILFSDILVVPYAMGQELAFVEGEGPKLGKIVPGNFEAARLAPVYETVRRVKRELPEGKALIGFAGAPWTVACYMVQGHGGDFPAAREMAERQPGEFRKLIDRLVDATTSHLLLQIEAGADAVQIFDSWSGLAPDFNSHVIAPTREIVSRLREKYPGVPVIGFPRGAGGRALPYARETGADCLALDTGASFPETKLCLQGNLDPETLLEGGRALEEETLKILTAMRGRPFIFNLGHGVIKETPPEHVALLADIIRNFR
jgi:uroporphyrinogen decarboxylase